MEGQTSGLRSFDKSKSAVKKLWFYEEIGGVVGGGRGTSTKKPIRGFNIYKNTTNIT